MMAESIYNTSRMDQEMRAEARWRRFAGRAEPGARPEMPREFVRLQERLAVQRRRFLRRIQTLKTDNVDTELVHWFLNEADSLHAMRQEVDRLGSELLREERLGSGELALEAWTMYVVNEEACLLGNLDGLQDGIFDGIGAAWRELHARQR